MTEAIRGFQNDHRWLSNFFWCKVTFEGLTYPTVEHAYASAKTLNMRKRVLISMADGPGQAKRMGHKLELRKDWYEVREGIMLELLIQKFSQPKFMKYLLETGDAYIEETNTWDDTFWGVCKGVGQNRLGLMIMSIRDDLKELQ